MFIFKMIFSTKKSIKIIILKSRIIITFLKLIISIIFIKIKIDYNAKTLMRYNYN